MSGALSEHVELVRPLAAGGMGEVLLARSKGHPELSDGLVVVKRCLDHHSDRDHQLRLLREEARVGAQLRHANIVETFGIDDDKRDPLVLMEYLPGLSMAQVLGDAKRTGQRLPLGVVLAVVRGAACGLHYAHELADKHGNPLKMVHRDVSPGNIFLTYDGDVKLLDFGIAKASDSDIRTKTGVLKGKIGYMSPAHVQGERIDARGDLWSLGVVFWESLVAERLFASKMPAQTLERILTMPVDKPSRYRPEIPPVLDALVLGLLERDMERRFSSARALVEAIDAAAAQDPMLDWRRADVAGTLAHRFSAHVEAYKAELEKHATLRVPQAKAHGLPKSAPKPAARAVRRRQAQRGDASLREEAPRRRRAAASLEPGHVPRRQEPPHAPDATQKSAPAPRHVRRGLPPPAALPVAGHDEADTAATAVARPVRRATKPLPTPGTKPVLEGDLEAFDDDVETAVLGQNFWSDDGPALSDIGPAEADSTAVLPDAWRTGGASLHDPDGSAASMLSGLDDPILDDRLSAVGQDEPPFDESRVTSTVPMGQHTSEVPTAAGSPLGRSPKARRDAPARVRDEMAWLSDASAPIELPSVSMSAEGVAEQETRVDADQPGLSAQATRIESTRDESERSAFDPDVSQKNLRPAATPGSGRAPSGRAITQRRGEEPALGHAPGTAPVSGTVPAQPGDGIFDVATGHGGHTLQQHAATIAVRQTVQPGVPRQALIAAGIGAALLVLGLVAAAFFGPAPRSNDALFVYPDARGDVVVFRLDDVPAEKTGAVEVFTPGDRVTLVERAGEREVSRAAFEALMQTKRAAYAGIPRTTGQRVRAFFLDGLWLVGLAVLLFAGSLVVRVPMSQRRALQAAGAGLMVLVTAAVLLVGGLRFPGLLAMWGADDAPPVRIAQPVPDDGLPAGSIDDE